MIAHFRCWDADNKGWLIKCLDKGFVFPLEGDWNDNQYCPHCMAKLPGLSEMKYFNNGVGYLSKY